MPRSSTCVDLNTIMLAELVTPETLNGLATRMGVTEATIQAWLGRGSRPQAPTQRNGERLARLVGLAPEEGILRSMSDATGWFTRAIPGRSKLVSFAARFLSGDAIRSFFLREFGPAVKNIHVASYTLEERFGAGVRPLRAWLHADSSHVGWQTFTLRQDSSLARPDPTVLVLSVRLWVAPRVPAIMDFAFIGLEKDQATILNSWTLQVERVPFKANESITVCVWTGGTTGKSAFDPGPPAGTNGQPSPDQLGIFFLLRSSSAFVVNGQGVPAPSTALSAVEVPRWRRLSPARGLVPPSGLRCYPGLFHPHAELTVDPSVRRLFAYGEGADDRA